MSGIGDVIRDVVDPFDFLGSDSAERATETQLALGGTALEETRRQFDMGQSRLEPFFQEAVPAIQLQAALSGAQGPEAQAQAFANFQEDPGTQFLRDEGTRLINAEAGATGGLGGGQRLRELTKFSQGLALQDLSNRFNRLGAVSGAGQTAATNQVQLGQRFSSDVGGILGNQANIVAGGQQAQQQGTNNLIQTGLTAGAIFSDARLKTNIEKVGELDSGLPWYVWDWTDEALGFVDKQPAEGVIAQEVAKVFPLAVSERNGFLTVDYGGIH